MIIEHVAVYRIDWFEYERGWGQTPDGYSLHLNQADALKYIDQYWASQPDRLNGMAPDFYVAPHDPHVVKVDYAVYDTLVKAFCLRVY